MLFYNKNLECVNNCIILNKYLLKQWNNLNNIIALK